MGGWEVAARSILAVKYHYIFFLEMSIMFLDNFKNVQCILSMFCISKYVFKIEKNANHWVFLESLGQSYPNL